MSLNIRHARLIACSTAAVMYRVHSLNSRVDLHVHVHCNWRIIESIQIDFLCESNRNYFWRIGMHYWLGDQREPLQRATTGEMVSRDGRETSLRLWRRVVAWQLRWSQEMDARPACACGVVSLLDLGATWDFEIQLTWNLFNSLSNLVGICFFQSVQNFMTHFST